MSTSHLKLCQFCWKLVDGDQRKYNSVLVMEIRQAVNNKIVDNLLMQCLKRQLEMDDFMNNLAIVCTKTNVGAPMSQGVPRVSFKLTERQVMKAAIVCRKTFGIRHELAGSG